jgi:hypothetical protein
MVHCLGIDAYQASHDAACRVLDGTLKLRSQDHLFIGRLKGEQRGLGNCLAYFLDGNNLQLEQTKEQLGRGI